RCSFFFQAEDGIRDFHVTGVQTCALPICRLLSAVQRRRRRENARGLVDEAAREPEVRRRIEEVLQRRGHRAEPGRAAEKEAVARSEERRVGKEGRARRAPKDVTKETKGGE